MTEEQKDLLEYLFKLSCEYYTEKTEDGHLQIPDAQSEKKFIAEVFMRCGAVLNKFDDK